MRFPRSAWWTPAKANGPPIPARAARRRSPSPSLASELPVPSSPRASRFAWEPPFAARPPADQRSSSARLASDASAHADGGGGGLYVVMCSLHGLVRGSEPQLGLDADTGGQARRRLLWRPHRL